VEIVSKETGDSGSGTINQGRLSLKMRHNDRSYLLTATVNDQSLAGDWQQLEGELRGAWSANWVDPTPSEDKSPAVVALYEYERADGQRIYSTNPDLKVRDVQRRAEPLCRVWRNPMSTLVLDYQAQPISRPTQ
jgi:hypothetical protein